LKRERTATSIAEFKSYPTLNHGFKEVATSFGIMKFSTKISIHRHMKEPQFPNGRTFECNTQDEWLIYRDFLSDKKGHELIGKHCVLNLNYKLQAFVSLSIFLRPVQMSRCCLVELN